ncbi:uncharacterized protein tn [Panulirus ornatus]|uniref:uncharacterized protein tn n=1 Tax=Panulirus ornatus TaxID=150431 RepID=UPI003A8C8123
MAHQLEQLLTCCICLDRFRNPKLLPCQHSVCMEPCMEGLVDYVRRQVKCPECRAEHRIPYNGVQGFPSNVTLQRFLEAHIEITGETPDPHTGQYMERCNVCNEKSYLSVCAHCEKKICEDCKAAHTDILKREIGRINNQVRRAAHRLNDQLANVERNIVSLKQNTGSVTEEIENISKRLQKSVRDRCDFLKSEIENYYNTELRNMMTLKESLDQEVSNIGANIELAEKHMDDNTPWDDSELMDTKDIFLKTMEFIRSFDYEGGDYSRRARFNPPDDLNKLASSLSTLGDLTFSSTNKMCDGYSSGPSMGSGLTKSKSDHRLAAQFRDQEDGYYGSGRTSPLMRRRFGERNVERHDEDSPADTGRRRFRSRFMRKEEDEERSVRFAEEDGPKRQRVLDTEDVSRGPLSGIVRLYDSPRVMKRFQERDQLKNKKKEEPPKTVQPTLPKPPVTPVQRKTTRQTSEDEIDKIKKQNKVTESTSSGATAVTAATASSASSAANTTPATTTTTTSKPAGERVSSIREDERQSRSDRTSTSPRSSTNHSPASSVTREDDSSRRREYSGSRTEASANSSSRSTAPTRKTSVDTGVTSVAQRSYPFSRSSSNSSVGDKDKNTSGTRSPRTLDTASYERRLSRSNSTDSNKSGDGSASPKKATGAAFSTEELKNRFMRTDSKPSTSKVESTSRSSAPSSSRFQSRFFGRAGTPSVEASKESGNDDDDEETTEDSESEESEESSEEEEEEEEEKETTSEYSRPDIGPLLGRSAQSRDVAGSTSSTSSNSSPRNRWGERNSYPSATTSVPDSGYASSRYGSSSDNSNGSSTSTRYGTSSSSGASTDSGVSTHRRPSYIDNSKSQTKDKEEEFESKYPYSSKYLNRSRASAPEEDSKPNFQSRFLSRSKSSAVIGPDDNDDSTPSTTTHGSGRARFEELKERRQRLARSKSSAGLEDEEGATGDTSSTSSYRSRYGRVDSESPSKTHISSTGASAAGGSSSSAGGDDGSSSSSQLSNWARYLKNKYGNRSGIAGSDSSSRSTGTGLGSSSGSSSGSGLGASTSGASSALSRPGSSSASGGRAISRSRSSHLLGLAKEGESSEDDSKNVHATPTFPQAGTLVPTPFGSLHRSQYLQKQRLLIKIGSRGSEPGNFTWPRGIAVGPDNSIVVADSSNHRVQVFDQQGKFIKEFGSYGSAEGEFDCLAGVAVNRIGQYIIADRYNHRIQIFDPSGMFLRSFGSQGGGDGRFSYPWGVTTDALGFIYVCDKENHRVQVFQSDGSFVGKFGSMGSKPGQLEHPHYIAVSSTNRVIVSDSNNHRVQIFDINGKVTTTFGSEGGEEGQFKFPRGVAVDDQGYIFVADSGNNRIQIFHPDGSFLRAFGCWGSGEGEFKGLEGVAVMSNGNILVCDRENHRVQVF